MARADAVRRAPGGLPWLRLRLGALAAGRSDLAGLGLTTAIAGCAAGAFLLVAWQRWNSYETNTYDLGFFDQVIWNTAHGSWFQTTFVPYNFAGQHIEPVLLAFVPAYWLGAGPPFLLMAQAIVAAAAAIPLYFAARRLGLAPIAAWAGAAAYLANPYLHRAIAFDFHPEVMLALPAFLAAWAIAAGRPRLAVALTLALLLFKEDAVFVALALAGLMWLRGLRRQAALAAAVSATWSALSVLVVMPLVRHGAPSDLVQRYGYLGGGGEGFALLLGIAIHPWRPVAGILSLPSLKTIGLFVAFSAPVALWRPWLLLGVLPGLALALLSSSPEQHTLQLHYAAELVPVAAIAGILAAARLQGRLPPSVLAGFLVVPAVLGALILHPLSSGHGDAPGRVHLAALSAAIALIPSDPNVSVSAQSGLLPRLTHRGQAHEFPSNYDRATYLLIDRYGFRSSQSIAAGSDWKLAVVRSETRLIFDHDGVALFRRDP